MPRKTLDPVVRFNRAYSEDPETGCWVWALSLDPDGYGHIRLGSRTDGTRRRMLAHRFAYQQFMGPLDPALTIDHLCRNRACVNPAHLEQVTPRENTQRGARATANECAKGHPFSGDNLVVTRSGKRRCRECANNYAREYQRKTGHRYSKSYRERRRHRNR